MKDWQPYALMVFAVAAGQVLKLGRKIEAGKAVTWRDIAVLCTLLPAFGAIGGAAAVHFSMPVWTILFLGSLAGWIGIGVIRVAINVLPYVVPAPIARAIAKVMQDDRSAEG